MRNHDNIVTLSTPLTIDHAWREYQQLVLAAARDPNLSGDLQHCEAMLRAWSRWKDLFLAVAA